MLQTLAISGDLVTYTPKRPPYGLVRIAVRVSILGHAHAHAALKLIKRLESEALGTHMCITTNSGG